MANVATSARLPARGGATPPVAGTARSIFRGELDNVGLSTLLTILEMERRSGMLIVQRGRQLGRLWVRDGRVIRARIEGARRPGGAGTEAIYQLLGWTDGQFELWQAVVDGADEVGTSTTFLLMEAARRIDEARGVIHDVTATDASW